MVNIRPRHARQARFAGIGEEGQQKLAAGSAAIVGLGALGSVSAQTLARAGVGKLILIDRDFVEDTNLQRQVLYEERDAAEGTPKAEAARRALARIDGAIELLTFAEDLTASNIERLLRGANIIIDGTDNFNTRYLINDYAVERGVPWIYGAAVSSSGLVMTIIPGETACLRCVFPEPTPPEDTPTCETSGIVASASGMIALAQAAEAMKLLCGRREDVLRGLLHIDPWACAYRVLAADRDPNCSCCGPAAERPWLRGARGDASLILCGRSSVQVSPPPGARALDLQQMAARVPGVERVHAFSLRFIADGHSITLFQDGRAIIGGTTDTALARSLYAKYIGG